MSALQSVMSQLVISIRCNCITPAAELDSKQGGQCAAAPVRTCFQAGCLRCALCMTHLFVYDNAFIDPRGDNSNCHIDIILIFMNENYNQLKRKIHVFFASYRKYFNQIQFS